MNEKTVTIDGIERKMRANALSPRLYRAKFKRDMIRDMTGMLNVYKEKDALLKRQQKDPESVTEDDIHEVDYKMLDYLEVFENVAWLFLRQAGEDIPDDPDKWLEGIEGMFTIYTIMPTIAELWAENQITTSVPKNPAGHR